MGAVAASALIWVAVRDGSPTLDNTTVANRAAEGRGAGGNIPVPETAASAPKRAGGHRCASSAD
jgi:hypothetical protein